MNIFGQLKEKLSQFIEVQLKLLKLGIISNVSNVFSYLIFIFVCLFLFFCTFIFASFGIIEWLTETGLSKTISYFIVTGGYLLLLALILVLRKSFTRFFANGFVKHLTADEGDDRSNN